MKIEKDLIPEKEVAAEAELWPCFKSAHLFFHCWISYVVSGNTRSRRRYAKGAQEARSAGREETKTC